MLYSFCCFQLYTLDRSHFNKYWQPVSVPRWKICKGTLHISPRIDPQSSKAHFEISHHHFSPYGHGESWVKGQDGSIKCAPEVGEN